MATMNPLIATDAAEYARHVRGGGWALGLLVARNVLTDSPPGSKIVSDETILKVSAHAFADLTGVSHATVSRHLRRWNHAATLGHVPPSDTLSPGTELALDAAALPEWKGFPIGPTLTFPEAAPEPDPEPEPEAAAQEPPEAAVPLPDPVADHAVGVGPQAYQVLKKATEMIDGIGTASEALAYVAAAEEALARLRERSA